MNTENNEPRKYKRYAEAFKRSAVELWLQGVWTIEQTAHELGISTQSLKRSRKQLAMETFLKSSDRFQIPCGL